ncbi:MAG: hypothetical protein WAL45_02765 [Terracidiphilus sp.]
MNSYTRKTISLLTMGIALAVSAVQAHAQTIESVFQAVTKGGIDAAPQNFAGIRGATVFTEAGGSAYFCSPDFLAATGGGVLPMLRIEYFPAGADAGVLWRLSFGVTVPRARDEVPAKVQALLSSAIPPSFVYQGIMPNLMSDPDNGEITFGWKGPGNVSLVVESFQDSVRANSTRNLSISIEHQLPR